MFPPFPCNGLKYGTFSSGPYRVSLPPSLLPVVALGSKRSIYRFVEGRGRGEIGGGGGGPVGFLAIFEYQFLT